MIRRNDDIVPPQKREAFYAAAVAGLRALDARERAPRRFGADADTRWASFKGALTEADRIDFLLRDAAVTWGAAFSPAETFELFGLAPDEPFGPDWQPLGSQTARCYLEGNGGVVELGDLSKLLGIKSGAVDMPSIAPSTRLAVAGGAALILGLDDAFVSAQSAARRRAFEEFTVPFGAGISVRDWFIQTGDCVLLPYVSLGGEPHPIESRLGTHILWPYRTSLGRRLIFGKTPSQKGMLWFEHMYRDKPKLRTPLSVVHPFVSTHNHFALSRGDVLFNKTARIVKLPDEASESEYRAITGYLNSSVVGFWCRLVMYPKGGATMGEGAIVTPYPWMDRLEYAGNLLQQLQVPKLEDLREKLLDLVVAAEETVAKMAEHAADKVVATTLTNTPTLAALRDARTKSLAERARLRGVLVSLQEEIDWRVYGLFGLPTVIAPSAEAVSIPVEPNCRPFEVRLARAASADISASEWFRVHKREPPTDVGGPLADLYRQRLRLLDDPEHGRELRLLETPETKRRWSPPDDTKAFNNVVRTWMLERVETAFREQSTPELRTARQLALDLGREPAVQAAHELLTEVSGVDLVRLISDLVDAEGVPFLAGHRYSETGMEKRGTWEETWRLQRLEDAGTIEPELKRLGLKSIPVPDKYANKDFLRHYWGHRGKLDVPKERFVTFPGGNTEDDPTPLVGWAGWDHLQTSQALAGLYQRRKTEDGWTGERLVPLLAGLAERVPWLLQWHNDFNDTYGMKVGEFFRDFVAGQAHELGVAVDFTKATDDLRTWTPPATPKRKTLEPDEAYAAFLRWTPELEEDSDDDEDSEPPEGPTVDELAGEAGASKSLVNKAIKKLLADGRIEKLDGRPVRYVATGDDL